MKRKIGNKQKLFESLTNKMNPLMKIVAIQYAYKTPSSM